MKTNDIVMFTGEGLYEKWFYGKIGKIIRRTKNHICIEWLAPAKYFDRYTKKSHFHVNNFTLIKNT